MKLYITGHTSGLGKELYDFFKQAGHEVTGFSKSNGYDLDENLIDIVNQVDADSIFINNAYANGIQSQYIPALHEKVDKMIVMGSIAAQNPDPDMPTYSEHKKELRDTFYKYASVKSNTDYLLLNLTSSSYKDFNLVLKTIIHWMSQPDIIEIGFNINE